MPYEINSEEENVIAQYTRMATVGLCHLVFTMTTGYAQDVRPWLNELKATLGPPVVVAQAEEAELPWGVWQFPGITQPEPGHLIVSFSRSEDRPFDSASGYKPVATYESMDGGKTWRSCNQEPLLRMLCHRANGDIIFRDRVAPKEIPKDSLPPPLDISSSGPSFACTVRNPAQVPKALLPQAYVVRRRAGSSEWERVAITVNDPGEALITHDPAGKDYVIAGHWGNGANQVIELKDRSLLNISVGFRLDENRKPVPKWTCYCSRSMDDGLTWTFQGVIAQCDENDPLHGYSEPCATILPDGSLLAALRTEHGMEANQRTGVMYLAQSYDDGKTWSRPRTVNPFGVYPRLLTLENGITVMSFGRPGVNMLFNADGRGERWQGLTLLVNEGQRFTRTSGYTGMVPTGPDSFIIVYDQFDYPNAQGQPRKTILVRAGTIPCNPDK